MLAVAGNIVTAWSWFGTNMLGIGLHSYGFMDSSVFWLVLWVAIQLIIIALGMLTSVKDNIQPPTKRASGKQPVAIA